MSEYLTPKKASNLLKVSTITLINWEKQEKISSIRTRGNHRR